MQDQNAYNKSNSKNTVDLGKMMDGLLIHIRTIICVTVVCTILGFCISKFAITPQYTSGSTIFLTPMIDQNTGSADYNSSMANEKLVTNVVNLMTEDNIMRQVVKETGIKDVNKVRNSIAVTNKPNTELVKVTATTEDPVLSAEIANTTVSVFMDTMQNNINVRNIEIVDKAHPATKPSSPSVKKDTVLSAFVGFIASCAIVVIRMILNTRTKTKEEAEQYFDLPVFCVIPESKSLSKGEK